MVSHEELLSQMREIDVLICRCGVRLTYIVWELADVELFFFSQHSALILQKLYTNQSNRLLIDMYLWQNAVTFLHMEWTWSTDRLTGLLIIILLFVCLLFVVCLFVCVLQEVVDLVNNSQDLAEEVGNGADPLITIRWDIKLCKTIQLYRYSCSTLWLLLTVCQLTCFWSFQLLNNVVLLQTVLIMNTFIIIITCNFIAFVVL